MLRYVVTVVAFALCVTAQQRPPPRNGAAPPAPPPQPAEPCPPVTGREWICSIEYLDPRRNNRVVNESLSSPCYKDDMCYLGPVMSMGLSGPMNGPPVTVRKWICGPRPCRMFATSGQGERFEVRTGTVECRFGDTCENGPANIQVNGSSYEAWYCKAASEEVKLETLASSWAPILCSINSTQNGYQQLKACDLGAGCTDGPYYQWVNGIQYEFNMCTAPPFVGAMKMSKDWSAIQIMDHLYVGLMETGRAFVQEGYVTLEFGGPHGVITFMREQMEIFRAHYEWLVQISEMHGKEVKLEGQLEKIFNDVQLHAYILREIAAKVWGESAATKWVMDFRKGQDYLYGVINGEDEEPSAAQWFAWVKQGFDAIAKAIENPDSVRNQQEVRGIWGQMQANRERLVSAVLDLPNPGEILDNFMEVSKRMDLVWNLISHGPLPRGYSKQKLIKDVRDGMADVIGEIMKRKPPAERLEEIIEKIRELEYEIQEGNTRGDKARYAFMKAHEMLGNFMDWVDDHASDELKDHIEETVGKFGMLWNHISNGPTAPGVTAQAVVSQVIMYFRKIYARIRDMPPPPPKMPPAPPKAKDGMMGGDGPDPRDILDRVMRAIDDVGRGARGGDDREDREEPRPNGNGDRPNPMDLIDRLQERIRGIGRELQEGMGGGEGYGNGGGEAKGKSKGGSGYGNGGGGNGYGNGGEGNGYGNGGGGNGYGNGGGGNGYGNGGGGDGDLREIVEGLQKRIAELTEGRDGGMGGGMGGGMSGEMGEYEEKEGEGDSCPKQYWRYLIPEDETNQWVTDGPDSFYGYTPMTPAK